MNELLNVAREGLVTALGLIEVLKTADVTPRVGTRKELDQNVESARQHLLDVLRTIDDAEENTAPNYGARNR